MTLSKNFEETPIAKLLIQFSIPTIISSSVHALYNIVDRIYIGKALGTEALAGITITFPVFILSIALGVLVGNGSSSIISIRLGEKNIKAAEQTLGNTFGLFAIIGLFVTIFAIIFLRPMLTLVGATEITMPYAYEYLIWFLPFMLFDFMAMGTNGCIRSEGNPKLAMGIAIMGAVINIILDPIFLFVFDMGIKGVAIATVIARIITALTVIWHFTGSKHRLLNLKRKYLIPKWRIIKPMLSIGASPFSMNLATSFVAVFSNRALLANGGDIAIGALGAIQSIFVIIETPLRGLMMAGQPIIGYNYGAGLYDRVKQTVKTAYAYSFVISISGLALIYSFGRFFVSLFSKGDPQLIEMGYSGIKIFLFMIPLVGIHMMSTMFFQAIGRFKEAILLNLLRKVFLYLPVLWVLPRFIGLNGVWATAPVADFLSAVIAIIMVNYYFKTKLHLAS